MKYKENQTVFVIAYKHVRRGTVVRVVECVLSDSIYFISINDFPYLLEYREKYVYEKESEAYEHVLEELELQEENLGCEMLELQHKQEMIKMKIRELKNEDK